MEQADALATLALTHATGLFSVAGSVLVICLAAVMLPMCRSTATATCWSISSRAMATPMLPSRRRLAV